MRQWRKLVTHNATIGGVPHAEASTFEGDGVCTDTAGLVRTRVVVHYVKPKKQGDAQEGCIRFGDDPVEWMNFAKICKAKNLFNKKKQQQAASALNN
jgi:hypothetical protein